MRGKKTEGDFPHLYAFIEFLITAAKLKVLNRDQWESFLPFNKTVGWGLEGYSEDSACEYPLRCFLPIAGGHTAHFIENFIQHLDILNSADCFLWDRAVLI